MILDLILINIFILGAPMAVLGNKETDQEKSQVRDENHLQLDVIPDDLINKLNVDLEKVDIGRLHRKMNQILVQYGDDIVVNNTRRQALHDREGHKGYRSAERYLVRQKALDMIVQLLYMGRQKLRLMEASEFFDSKSFGFRIAYAHRRCQRIWRNLGIIYRLAVHRNGSHWSIESKSYYKHLILHHKAARMHVDFVYLFWLILKLDVANKDRQRRLMALDILKSGGQLPPGMGLPVTWG